MRRAGLVLVIGALVSHAGSLKAAPLVDITEFNAREDCLYREIGRLMKARGATVTALQDIALTTAQLCSQAVRTRLLRASPSIREGEELARYDQLQIEQRALAIGMELREKGKR